ncbi:MAG: rRNA (uracil1939-C5)-methyltransferase [Solirubrobacteraceae bacterium]|jgi:23S rRNA (uracil1939-C5)-methyltransferase|nr:rRNA (uracil1939-C5)-methyltransferase [Solirubrobacteraceae bacterium]
MEANAVTSARPELGATLELSVDSLAYGGAGVARHEGYVVFVAGAVTGDRVRAVVTKRRRAYAEARTVEVLTPGPDRIAPVADHPGVPWQVLRYDAQLAAKSDQVAEALRRIGHLEDFELEPIVPAVDQWRYRNKLEYSFGTDPDGALACGFHAPGRWDVIEPMGDCLLASERGNEARRQVLEWCRAQGLQAYDRRARTGVLRNLVVREGRRTGELQVRLVTSPCELDGASLAAAVDADGLLRTVTDDLGETTARGETELLSGSPLLAEVVGELRFAISPTAFFQTNTEMAERLYALAADYAALEGWERVFDLYSGIGTIGLSIAARAGELWGLEVSEDAVRDAKRNAHANDVVNARFRAGDVRREMRDLVEKAGRPDVMVVDPPRAGLSQKIVRRIVEASPRRIVYVSCNPTTLAPNAAQLAEAGWSLRRVRPVDMFPQTPHIECVALLERG